MSTTTDKIDIRTVLPMTLGGDLRCPCCGANVVLEQIMLWHAQTGNIYCFEVRCETKPDGGMMFALWLRNHGSLMHHSQPEWRARVLTWLNETYYMGSDDK